MANTALNRTTQLLLTNKSGGALVQGDVVVLDNTNAKGFTTTTTAGLSTRGLGVILEPNGIANNSTGMVAVGGWVPKVNLNTAATIGQFIKTHTVAGQGTPHSAPRVEGSFAVALQASATPESILFGSPDGPASATGDFSSNTATSVDSEIVLFSGTGGKTGKRATTTGMLKGTSGVLSAGTDGTDFLSPSTGWTKITSSSPSGTGVVTFSSLGSYKHLKVLYSCRGTEAATFSTMLLRFNADSGNNYDSQEIYASATTPGASEALAAAQILIGFSTAANSPANTASTGEITIFDYAGTTFYKGATNLFQHMRNTTSGNYYWSSRGGQWRSTSAITSITITLGSGNYVAGSLFTLYGLP